MATKQHDAKNECSLHVCSKQVLKPVAEDETEAPPKLALVSPTAEASHSPFDLAVEWSKHAAKPRGDLSMSLNRELML